GRKHLIERFRSPSLFSLFSPVKILFPQLHVPIRQIDKMLPTIVMLEPEVDLHKRPPLRPFRLPDEVHRSLMGGPIRLDRITLDTRADDVFPSRRSAAVARDDVIEVQVFAIKLVTAILARVLIPLEDIMPRK